MSFIRLVGAVLVGAVIATAVLIARPNDVDAIRAVVEREWSHGVASQSAVPPASSSVVAVKDAEDGGFNHVLGPTVSIRSPNFDKYGFFAAVTLRLIIGPSGDVTQAVATKGPKEFFAEAERLALRVKFIPFQRNGKPVTARFDSFSIGIFPPERRPDYSVAFPEIRDWKSLRMTLLRTACYGDCPAYGIEIRGDGSVSYEGTSSVALGGKHHAVLSQDSVHQLFETFRRANFFWLSREYDSEITDQPACEVEISFDGRVRHVGDYVGLQVGMPDAVIDVEEAIDRIANSDRWLKGNDETVPSLLAEGWDFKRADEANTMMVMGVASRGTASALRELIAAGAPATTKSKTGSGQFGSYPGETALEIGAWRGDPEIVTALFQSRTKWEKSTISEALINAASRGASEVMGILLSYSAERPRNYRRFGGRTALMAAAGSGVPDAVKFMTNDIVWSTTALEVDAVDDKGRTALFQAGAPEFASALDEAKIDRAIVVALLLKAGAVVDHRDKQGNTALIVTQYPDVAAALIKGGAKVNAQNEAGDTALMVAYDPEMISALLNAGADPNIRNKKGETALEAAGHGWNAKETVPVIEKWIAAHKAAAEK